MVALENTHNAMNGSALPATYVSEVAQIAHGAGAKLHVDGARIFNAAIALETEAANLVREADSVSFCLSKGLACPIGSLIAGSHEFVEDARRTRRIVGGGMRQIGVLAAAGIVALDEMVDRLADDHANAHLLAEGLASIPGVTATPELRADEHPLLHPRRGHRRRRLPRALQGARRPLQRRPRALAHGHPLRHRARGHRVRGRADSRGRKIAGLSPRVLLALPFVLVLLLSACSGDDGPPASDVVATIPWQTDESHTYTVTE